jgi:hypothetical protein
MRGRERTGNARWRPTGPVCYHAGKIRLFERASAAIQLIPPSFAPALREEIH